MTEGAKSMDDWYVVQTNPNCEKKAVGELRRVGLRAYIPTQYSQYRHREKGDAVKSRPLLIGYVFVRFNEAPAMLAGVPQFRVARSCQGVRDFVRVAREVGEGARSNSPAALQWEPLAIPHSMVAAFMRRQRLREFGRPEPINQTKRMAQLRQTFRPGKVVRIADGPFEGFLAILKKLTDGGKLEVETSLFGRPTKIMIDASQAAPLVREAA